MEVKMMPRTNKQYTDAELLKLIDKATKNFRGFFPTLQGAIGALLTGRQLGWKPLLLIHDKKTIKKYEKILGVEFRNVMPEVGPLANKSIAWKASQRVSNFWKAVKGEIPNIRSPEVE